MNEKVIIDVATLYEGTAKLKEFGKYSDKALEMAGEGNFITLTGPGPVWLYLLLAHDLHGKAKVLTYTSPASGDVTVFDHNPE